MELKIFVILLLWRFSATTLTTGNHTPIKSPVLEFRPLPKDRRETAIWFAPYLVNTTKYWIDELNSFLKPYHDREQTDIWYDCSSNQLPSTVKNCQEKIKPKLFPCIKEQNYGYHRGSPCVFLTLTQIPEGWAPVYYNRSNRPTEMPMFLKDDIWHSEDKEQKVWVDCQGESAADVELAGLIRYVPENGFPARSFLNSSATGCLPPVMAIYFNRPASGVVIMIRCTMWAKNIPRDPENKLGTVHFELLID